MADSAPADRMVQIHLADNQVNRPPALVGLAGRAVDPAAVRADLAAAVVEDLAAVRAAARVAVDNSVDNVPARLDPMVQRRRNRFGARSAYRAWLQAAFASVSPNAM